MFTVSVPDHDVEYVRYDSISKQWWLCLNSCGNSELLTLAANPKIDGISRNRAGTGWKAHCMLPERKFIFGMTPIAAAQAAMYDGRPVLPPLRPVLLPLPR